MSIGIDDKALIDSLTGPRADQAVPKRTPGLFGLLKEDVSAVRARDPAARGTLDVLAVYPGLHAVLAHRLANRMWRRGWRFPARLLSFLARMVTNIDIHPGATIGRRFFIDHGAGVVIGETAEIGDDCTLFHGVTLGGVSASRGKRHPTLCDGVLVGAGAKILGAITLGTGVRVGANSVVIEDVVEGATVVGIPGRVVKPSHPNREGQGSAGRRLAGGIDLDHHLMPDPVGRALACLLDRMNALETEVNRLRMAAGETPLPVCLDCADDACSGDCIGLPVHAQTPPHPSGAQP